MQPAVAAEAATQDTRVRAPVAGSRRSALTASSSVPTASTVRPSGEIATEEARASPPIGVQSASATSLRQPAPGPSCVRTPVLTSRWNAVTVPAVAERDVERRPVGRDRDRRGPVDAGDRRAGRATGTQASGCAREGRQPSRGGVARERDDRVGGAGPDVDEAAVGRDGDRIRAGQRRARSRSRVSPWRRCSPRCR